MYLPIYIMTLLPIYNLRICPFLLVLQYLTITLYAIIMEWSIFWWVIWKILFCFTYRVYLNTCALRECRTWSAHLLSTKQGGQGGVGIHNQTHPDLRLNRRIIVQTSLNSTPGERVYGNKVDFLTFAVYSDKPMLTLCQWSMFWVNHHEKTLNISWKTYKTRIIVGDNRWNTWHNHYFSAPRRGVRVY